MALAELVDQCEGVSFLQKSLENGRLAHAYLMFGPDQSFLEKVALNLAKTLNCNNPVQSENSTLTVDCCDQCDSCRKTDRSRHPDIQIVRPESKLRRISIHKIRELMRTVYLSPLLGAYKVFILAGADRLGPEAANAFLKTLEEPPDGSLLILLTSDPDKVLETLRSRCLRVNIGMGQRVNFSTDQQDWILNFSKIATETKQGLLARYQLLSPLVEWLKKRHELIKKQLEAESPLKLIDELEPAAKERFKKELDAAIEAEYRRERSEQLKLIQWWLRDIWLSCLGNDGASFRFPTAADYTRIVSARISSRQARQNLDQFETTQGLLQTNVQEGLTLEVGLLKLNL